MKTLRTLLVIIALCGFAFGGHPTTTNSIAGTSLCTGYGPTDGQVISYTTGSSPNPCYTTSTISGSGAGTTTNTITFQTSGGAASGTTFNGSSPVTIDFSTIGAVPTSRTVNGRALTGNVTVTSSDVGLSNVTNIAQAPVGATYIVQTSDATLTSEQALGSLATGLLKNTTSTGVLSIATPGTDYVTPAGVPITEIDNATVAVTPSSGKINFAAGTNVTLATAGNTLTITAATATATAFSALTGSTNTGQALVIGAGSSLSTAGGGTIAATTAASATTAGSATTAAQINGGSVPISAPLLGTNSSSQPVSVTTLPASVQPVHTGDVTNIGGSLAMTVKGINNVQLSSLGTGLLKNTTGTGVPSIAVAGTDYLSPSGTGSALTGLTASQISGYIANATVTIGTTAIPANGCTTASTVSMPGMLTSSTINLTPNSDTSGVTGWGATGGLVIRTWPTANQANVKVCNQTSASITPSASVTFNISGR